MDGSKRKAETQAERFMLSLGAIYVTVNASYQNVPLEVRLDPASQAEFFDLGVIYPSIFDVFARRRIKKISRDMLSGGWDVFDGQGALQMAWKLLNGLHDNLYQEHLAKTPSARIAGPPTILAWDLSRMVSVLCAAVTADYIQDVRSCWELMSQAAVKAQAHYGSWQQYGVGFLDGRNFWLGEREDSDDDGEREEACRWLLRHPQSPWMTVPWNTDLQRNASY